MTTEDLDRIEDTDYYVWHKPDHINCPEFFVLFRLSDDYIHIERFFTSLD